MFFNPTRNPIGGASQNHQSQPNRRDAELWIQNDTANHTARIRSMQNEFAVTTLQGANTSAQSSGSHNSTSNGQSGASRSSGGASFNGFGASASRAQADYHASSNTHVNQGAQQSGNESAAQITHTPFIRSGFGNLAPGERKPYRRGIQNITVVIDEEMIEDNKQVNPNDHPVWVIRATSNGGYSFSKCHC